MKFKDLKPGDTFDFVSPVASQNSFYERCEKISTRKYKYSTLHGPFESQVGSINVEVYNVEET